MKLLTRKLNLSFEKVDNQNLIVLNGELAYNDICSIYIIQVFKIMPIDI